MTSNTPAPRTRSAWRDPWAWVSALAVLPLLLRSLGAPLGEPVAEDFDFLGRALLFPGNSLLDGGGSGAFWRPVAHQLYYEVMGRLMLAHPAWVAAIHVLLLGLAGWLLYRVVRPAFAGPVAAAIASFPLLAESTRTLIAWPSHFVDLGLFLFSVLALHEASRRRWWTAIPALLLALLCKELAVVTAVLMPFVPRRDGGRPADRTRLLIGCGAVVVAWAAAYAWVRTHAGLELPHGLERERSLLANSMAPRLWWAEINSVRATLSLARVPEATDWAVLGATVVILGVTLIAFVRDPRARERLRRTRGWVVWGCAWFALGAASLASMYPFWAPNRVQFASLGLGAAAVSFTSAAHPALAAGLVVTRLAALAIAPGASAAITPEPEERGAFMDFGRLTRLQRLMRASREALKRAHPTLTSGATIGYRNLPLSSAYAFGGPHAVQAWYGDPTLRWIDFQEFERHSDRPVVAFIDYQPPPYAPVAVLDPDALRWMSIAKQHLLAGRAEPALVALARADSLERDPSAAIFLGDNAGRRAAALVGLRRYEEAEREARTALRASTQDIGARYVLAITSLARKERVQALAEIDSLLMVAPRDRDALELRAAIIEAERR